jgi:hypothetical protein
MADPTTGLPPQFVGRYPGAPLPVPAPVAPSQYLPRFDTNARGTTSGAIPTFTPAVAPPAAPIGQPIDTAALVRATQGAPVQPTVPAAAASTAPTTPATPSVNAVTPLPGTDDPNSTGPVNVPPLPANMGGQVGPATAAVNLPTLTGGVGGAAGGTSAAGGGGGDPTLWDPFNQSNGGNVPLSSLPGGGTIVNGHFADPRDAIAYGFQQQLAYQMASMRNLNAMAGNGGDLGFHARAAMLAAAVGQNNFGQVQGQGADSLNQAIAGETEAQTNATAQETVENTRKEAEEYGVDNTPRPISQHTGYNAYGMPTGSDTLYGTSGAGAVTPVAAPGNGVKPTLENFLTRARAANPGVSDDTLKAYYAKAYGN